MSLYIKKEPNELRFIPLLTLYKDILLFSYYTGRMVRSYFMGCSAKKSKGYCQQITVCVSLPDSLAIVCCDSWSHCTANTVPLCMSAGHVTPINCPCICLHCAVYIHIITFLHYVEKNQKWLLSVPLCCLPPAYIQNNMNKSTCNG